MKKTVIFLLLVASTGLGELSKKEIKSLQKLFTIERVSFDTEKKHGTKFEIVTIEYSTDVAEDDSNSYYSPKVSMKVVVELTDEDDITYLVEERQEHYSIPSSSYDTQYCKLIIPYGEYEKLKVTGYSIQHGIKKGGTFVPYEEKLFKTKTLEELNSRTTADYPNKDIRLHHTSSEDSDYF